MRKYTFDDHNNYTGFNDSDIITDTYTHIEPTSSEHTKWTGSEWIVSEYIEETFDSKKNNKIGQVREYFDEMVNSAVANAADFEVQTWDTQRQEWLRYIDDTNAHTPYCDMLASTRGITKESLMTKIGNNVVGYAQTQGQLHAIEDALSNCTTEEQLDAVWN